MPPTRISDRLLSWASLLDEATREQAEALSRLPIIHGHVALMPDAHLGKGSTVGSVIPTHRAVIPAAIGVDIGCGMGAVKTNLTSHDLPDDLNGFVESLRKVVPAGLGKWHAKPGAQARRWWERYGPDAPELAHKERDRVLNQLGTLGSGNHFLEIVLDETDAVWVFLHSGSRGIGNLLAQQHMKVARRCCDYDLMALRGSKQDLDLAWLTEGTEEFAEYIHAMQWAQAYALENRSIMMTNSLEHLFRWVSRGRRRPDEAPVEVERINCHHNFTQPERWPDQQETKKVWVTRKGAIEATKGKLGLIPGSMGARSYVVRGLGNPASFNSCAHGAGRLMSRTRARRELSTADFAEKMGNRAWLRSSAAKLLDEHPDSYKPIDRIMADQTDLVEIVHTFESVVNYKGVS